MMGNPWVDAGPHSMMHPAMAWGAGVPQDGGCMVNGGSTEAAAAGPADAVAMVGAGGTSLRALNGWTVVWVGERAFRASAAMKEQMENIGFLVKIYRSHDKCCRALDKKQIIPPASAFVVSEADAEHLLRYLQARDARQVHVVVDIDQSTNPAAAQLIVHSPSIPEDSNVLVASTWDEVLMGLRSIGMQVMAHQMSNMGPCGGEEDGQPGSSVLVPMTACPMMATDAGDAPAAATSPWTLVWVSDQAFKPAACGQKAKLEALGCQVKGYKTHKNAARALDKKRALIRTVVLVSGPEAAPFLAYLASRPEISATQVIVEASARAVPVREGPSCKVADSFDSALAAVMQVVADPGFA